VEGSPACYVGWQDLVNQIVWDGEGGLKGWTRKKYGRSGNCFPLESCAEGELLITMLWTAIASPWGSGRTYSQFAVGDRSASSMTAIGKVMGNWEEYYYFQLCRPPPFLGFGESLWGSLTNRLQHYQPLHGFSLKVDAQFSAVRGYLVMIDGYGFKAGCGRSHPQCPRPPRAFVLLFHFFSPTGASIRYFPRLSGI